MSQAKQYGTGTGTGTGPGPGPGKKSSFAQTCNQLSLFLKEKGSLRDFRLGANVKFDDTEKSPAATMTVDLLSSMENRVQGTAQTEKLMKLLHHVSSDCFNKREDSTNKATSSRPVAVSESKTAPMTIFYDGQVIVLDNISEDRARDMMLAAGSCTPCSKIETGVAKASTSNHTPAISESHRQVHQLQPNDLDLPIARRASLHKFLAKRKDRATVRAPYQLHNPSPEAGYSKDDKFDLNL